MKGLINPFHASKVEVEKTVTEKYYNDRKAKYDENYEVEDENEYFLLLKRKDNSMGTLVRKKFEGYYAKTTKS